ncbi:hypothetical protein [Ruegeria arenilitoris]|uniref:hypothetical protein n=1 Tax=Ruegeria arenilitoris TaxID=1173585 RepID=UPI00147A4E2F|nr:hypothetical protein [Ruegeria arenilitoris]
MNRSFASELGKTDSTIRAGTDKEPRLFRRRLPDAFFPDVLLCCPHAVLTACAGSYDRTVLTATAENYETFLPAGTGADSRYFEDDNRDRLAAVNEEIDKTLAQVPRGRSLNILALSGGGRHGA